MTYKQSANVDKKALVFLDSSIKKVAANLREGEFILDIGGAKPFQKYLAPYKELLEGKFKTLDIDPNTHPDIVGSALELPFEDGSVGGAFSIAVLEHLPDPFKAVKEMYRVLRPGGQVVVYAPFLHPFHGNERFNDYWRFTHQGMKELFDKAGFIDIKISNNGTVTQIVKKSLPKKIRWANLLLRPMIWVYGKASPYSKNMTPGFYLHAKKSEGWQHPRIASTS